MKSYDVCVATFSLSKYFRVSKATFHLCDNLMKNTSHNHFLEQKVYLCVPFYIPTPDTKSPDIIWQQFPLPIKSLQSVCCIKHRLPFLVCPIILRGLSAFKIQLAQPRKLNKPLVGSLYRFINYLFY